MAFYLYVYLRDTVAESPDITLTGGCPPDFTGVHVSFQNIPITCLLKGNKVLKIC